MDGIACALSKKCRAEKSKEIVTNMNEEQNEYDRIYQKEEKEK
ncbi:hypothetical protein ACQPU1_12285 [Clostridium paraputrificum]